MTIPFGPWLPDQPEYGATHVTDALNVVPPSTSGYKPFPSFSNVTSALTARAQGAVSVRGVAASAAGTIFNFSGDATKLYRMATDGLSWSDVSRTSGGAYATPSDGWWNFAVFGDEVIATNLADAVQSYTISSSTNFAALAGSPPRAAFVGVIRDFVVLSRVSSNFNRLQWCGINNITQWTPSAATMSDYQDVPDAGALKGFVGGEFGLVFMERSILRMAFEGPPTIFRFDKIAQTVGAWIEGSIAAYENLAFFMSHDGFYMVRGGSELVPIGSEKVDRWFAANVNASYTYRCTSAIDPSRKLYVLSFPSGASGDGTPDSLLLYHWPSGEWSRVSLDHEMVYTAAVQSTYTIDSMDSLDTPGDDFALTGDSLFFAGPGQLLLSGFDTLNRQGFFSGANMQAVIDTGFLEPVPGRKAMARRLRPLVEGTDVTPSVTPITKDRLQDTATLGTAVAVNANGVAPLRTNARYHKIRLTIPAGSVWTRTMGHSDEAFSPMGAR